MRLSRLITLAILLLGSTVLADETATLPKKVTVLDGEVEASGRWVSAVLLPAPVLPQINSVEVVCSRARGICQEAVASLYTQDDVPQLPRPFLTVSLSEYKVTRWDASGVTASSPKPAADVEIQIDLKTQAIIRQYRETKARGNQTANPDRVIRWELK